MSLQISVHVPVLEHLLRDPDHRADVDGTVDCPVLSAHPLTVSSGDLRLFVVDRDRVGSRAK